jgi:hypothetical protein
MTKNKLADLNDHLFAQLERLGDEDLTGDALSQEIDRARAVSQVATRVIDVGTLALSAQKFNDERMDTNSPLPKMLEA